MRVVHILNTDSYSGAENVAIQIIDYLKRTGNILKKENKVLNDGDIELIYMSKDGSIKEVLEKHNISFYAVDKIDGKAIKKMVRDLHPDILHCHDYTTSVLAAIYSRKKIVSHLHNNSPWIKKYGIFSWVYFLSCFRYSSILLVSDSIRKEYVFAHFLKKKIKVIGNPIDLNRIILGSEEYKVKEEYDICFLGRLSEQKNPLLFLDVIMEIKKRIVNIKVCMIGSGELREMVWREIKMRELEDNVDLLGFINNPYPYLKKSRFLLGTSIWEGFGLFAAEALALGKPVVCTKVGGLSSIVTDDCGYLCMNKQELVNSSLKLLQNRNIYEEKAKGAIVRIKELYDIKGYMAQIIKSYEN